MMAALTAEGPLPTPPPAQWKPSAADYVALKKLALDFGHWPVGPRVMFVSKPFSEMPPFDREVYYAGADPAAPQSLWVFENRNDFAADHRQRMDDALMLAAMDSGAAGPLWKGLYDRLRAADEALPASVSDRYRYRHGMMKVADANITAALHPAPIRNPDPVIDSLAAKIGQRELTELFKGLLRMPAPLEMVPGDLPPGRYAIYKGKVAGGKAIAVISKSAMENSALLGTSPDGLDDDMNAVYFSAAADSGAAGGAWKRRFDAAPDKTLFGAIAARAFKLMSQRSAAKSHADVAWIHANVPLSSSRERVAALLHRRGLKLEEGSPNPYVRFELGFTVACGKEMNVSFVFGRQGTLEKIDDSPESQTCL